LQVKSYQLDKLIRYLADHSVTPQHELIERMLNDLGKRGTIECTVAEVGRWMEKSGMCADYRTILDASDSK
jgi:DNA-binding PadR family transcriptional regulator